jgi:hypothetical protein
MADSDGICDDRAQAETEAGLRLRLALL